MEPAAREPRWVILETSDGRKLAGRTTFGWPVLAGQSADLFDWIEQADGRVALRSLATERYVGVSAEGVSAAQDDLDEGALFRPVESEGGGTAFQLADGVRYLSAPPGDEARLAADATTVGPAESFTAIPFELSRLPKGTSGCCGAWTVPEEGEAPGTLWNDVTHEQILRWGVTGVGRLESEDIWRFRWFWNLPGFEKQAYQGLDDADYKYPWCGNLVLNHENPRRRVFTWHDHFYNPKSGLNYMRGTTNAVTEGRRWFNLSVHAAARALKLGDSPPAALIAKAGHCLGLALHFLTDLTQPMHSANFTNVFGEEGRYPEIPRWADTRHSGFEHYAEIEVRSDYFSDYANRHPLRPTDVEIQGIPDVASFLHDTAENHHTLFHRKGGILDLAREKARHEISSWGKEANPELKDSLLLAPKVVSRFLVYWSRCVNQSWDALDQGSWYRLVEPTMDEWVCLDGENYKRAKFDDGRDLLFLLFNRDGTWSIGCKARKNALWRGVNGWFDEHWIGANSESLREPAPTSRFRIVRNSTPGRGGDTVWIYEATRDEAVTVADEMNGGHLRRWAASLPERQLFKLQKMGTILPGERTEIQKIWPGFLDPEHPWYGKG